VVEEDVVVELGVLEVVVEVVLEVVPEVVLVVVLEEDAVTGVVVKGEKMLGIEDRKESR
jgi:hypothetical protein